MKPRILFLNRSYWPDTEATGQLLTELCEGLAANFDVHVLAGQPNATASDVDWKNVDKRNNVTIHRVPHFSFAKKGMLRRGMNFLSFVYACHRHMRHMPQPDVVVFETDPFLLPFVADAFQRRTGCRQVGYLQDIYPDVAVNLEKVSNNWLVRRLRAGLFSVYRKCDQMIVLSNDMRELLQDSGIHHNRISVISNWADPELIFPAKAENLFRKQQALDGKFVVMYSGNLGLTQRLEEFVEAAALLQDDSDIQFVFVGAGAQKERLKKMAESISLSNLTFCDYQPLDQLAHSLSAADLHLVPLTNELSRCLMPSKLYGILAAGRPFLTNAPPDSELHTIAEIEGVGLTVEAGSPNRIADAIRRAKDSPGLLTEMGERARHLAENRFSKRTAIDKFTACMRRVLTGKDAMVEQAATTKTLQVNASSLAGELCCSVVIPVQDSPDTLTDLLERLAAQSVSPANVEVLICDDGSRRPIKHVADNWRSTFPQLRYLRQERRGGAAARNLGVLHAAADIVVLLDVDAEPDIDFIQRLTQAMAENTTWLGAEPTHLQRTDQGSSHTVPVFGANAQRQRGMAMAFRTNTLRQMGGFDESYAATFCDDVDLAMRIRPDGLIGAATEATVFHQKRRDRTSASEWQRRVRWRHFGLFASRHGVLPWDTESRTTFPRLRTLLAAAVSTPAKMAWTALRTSFGAPRKGLSQLGAAVAALTGGIAMAPAILMQETAQEPFGLPPIKNPKLGQSESSVLETPAVIREKSIRKVTGRAA